MNTYGVAHVIPNWEMQMQIGTLICGQTVKHLFSVSENDTRHAVFLCDLPLNLTRRWADNIAQHIRTEGSMMCAVQSQSVFLMDETRCGQFDRSVTEVNAVDASASTFDCERKGQIQRAEIQTECDTQTISKRTQFTGRRLSKKRAAPPLLRCRRADTIELNVPA